MHPSTIYLLVTSVLGKQAFDRYNEDFKARVKVHKVMYMLTEFRDPREFHPYYSWHMTGPYCPEVERDIREYILPNLDDLKDWKDGKLSEKGRTLVDKVRRFYSLDGSGEEIFADHRWFYLLGCIHYISMNEKHHKQPYRDPGLLSERMKRLAYIEGTPKMVDAAVRLYLERTEGWVRPKRPTKGLPKGA